MGTVVGAHGNDGHLRIAPESDNPNRYKAGSLLSIAGADYTVTSATSAGATLLVALEGIDDRTAAEALAGAPVLVDAKDVPPLPDGSYYHFQLIDLVVKDAAGSRLGVLAEVIQTGANDVYRVVGDAEEWLLPALSDAIIGVDLEQREMVVSVPEGLEPRPVAGPGKHRRRAQQRRSNRRPVR